MQWPAQAVNRTSAKSKFNFIPCDSFYVYCLDLMVKNFSINNLEWLCKACGVLACLFHTATRPLAPPVAESEGVNRASCLFN